MARQVRGDTLQLLDAARPNWLTWAPPGTSNHILWHAGHALWLQDVLCVRLLAGRPELPAGWDEKFGMNCRPVCETVDWPDRANIRNFLHDQLRRMLVLLSDTPDGRLAQTVDASRGSATISDRIIHGLHDEAKHSGEMYLIYKLCEAGA